jgi:membrane associated rhomboid family serine protease
MGAYLVCYPAARIKTIIFFGPVLLRKVRASWLLVLWFAQQFLFTGTGIAYAAHIGGFAFGALVGLYLRWRDAPRRRRLGPPPPPSAPPAPEPVAVS